METMNSHATARVALNPVDRLEVLTVIDNVVDLLLGDTDVAKRMRAGDPRWQQRRVTAPLLESGDAVDRVQSDRDRSSSCRARGLPSVRSRLRTANPAHGARPRKVRPCPLVAPSHCTGWRAAQALAAAFPAAFVPSSVGTRYLFQSAATGP